MKITIIYIWKWNPRQDVAAKCEAFRAAAAGPRSRRSRQKQIAGSDLFLESE
jgi:hypothetical protein